MKLTQEQIASYTEKAKAIYLSCDLPEDLTEKCISLDLDYLNNLIEWTEKFEKDSSVDLRFDFITWAFKRSSAESRFKENGVSDEQWKKIVSIGPDLREIDTFKQINARFNEAQKSLSLLNFKIDDYTFADISDSDKSDYDIDDNINQMIEKSSSFIENIREDLPKDDRIDSQINLINEEVDKLKKIREERILFNNEISNAFNGLSNTLNNTLKGLEANGLFKSANSKKTNNNQNQHVIDERTEPRPS